MITARLLSLFQTRFYSPIAYGYTRAYIMGVALAFKQIPTSEEVLQLNEKFSNPQQLIHQLLKPVVDADQSCYPKFEMKPCLEGRLWRARLSFVWPVPFHTAALSTDKQRAEHYAYLEACDMLQHLGLISTNGELVECRRLLEQSQTSHSFHHSHRMQFNSYAVNTDSGKQWLSVLDLHWPYNIRIVGKGLTRSAAETVASSLAYLSLKSKKLVDRANLVIRPANVIHLPTCQSQILAGQLPDYELWVDASSKGFGAYILSHSDRDQHTPIRWLQEPWPSHLYHEHRDLRQNSSFIEFYALVCAVFTWKKKFSGQCVVVWSDSKQAIDLINKGLTTESRTSHQKSIFVKLFETLHNTCWRYKICLIGRHVHREYNQAADSLAKSQMDRFYQMVPTAALHAKKSKKLLFIVPLVHQQSSSVERRQQQ